MYHADIALTNGHKQECHAVMRNRRIQMSFGCTYLELSNASRLPTVINFPARRLKTITVTEDVKLCRDAGKLSREDATAGEREMSKLSVRAVIRTVTNS